MFLPADSGLAVSSQEGRCSATLISNRKEQTGRVLPGSLQGRCLSRKAAVTLPEGHAEPEILG